MQISIAQQNYKIGDFKKNQEKIITAIQIAIEDKSELILFSELAIGGYPPKDLLQSKEFRSQCVENLESLKALSNKIAILIGTPVLIGDILENGACFLYHGEWKFVGKKILSSKGSLNEHHYFRAAAEKELITFNNQKIGIAIGDELLKEPAGEKMFGADPDFLFNLYASPFEYRKKEERILSFKEIAQTYQCPIVFCNTVGAQADLIFDGGSFVLNKKGELIQEFPLFEERVAQITVTSFMQAVSPPPFVKAASFFDPLLHIDRIHDALITGIRDYFNKMGFQKAILGSSGGIDSAVCIALACEALGKENVTAISMPSDFSTGHSVADAEQLSKNTGNPFEVIPIKGVYDSFLETLSHPFQNLPFNVAEENIQARSRQVILMALANKFGYILLNSSNKSELSVGYGTLYGDLAGGLSLLGDLYKTQVYALARYLNKGMEIIPRHIIDKAPSAELHPGQKDSDSLPDYADMDPILYQYIEEGLPVEKILQDTNLSPETIYRVISLINKNEYKRSQFCPILKISQKSFGERKMPIVGNLG